jgi:hypothetical protein
VCEKSDGQVNCLLVARLHSSRELTQPGLIVGLASDDVSHCTTHLVSERKLLTN